MKILAVDTTRKSASIFLIEDNNKKTYTLRDDEKQSEFLMLSIDKFLKENNLDITQIECFGVISGPGSFTGIRVGIATIKAFAYALNKNIISCTVFESVKNAINNGIFLTECTSNSFYYANIVNNEITDTGVIEKSELAKLNKETFVLEEEHILLNDSYKFNVLKNYSNLCCDKFIELAKLKSFTSPEPYYIQVSQAERNLEKKDD